MNIAEIRIDDYGPLRVSLDLGEGLNVVHGPNESGKTLLVDALLLLLADDDEHDRIGQSPHGYVVLEEGTGRRRLDAGETILDRFEAVSDVHLTPHEFRNAFVIRSADAALSEEDRFYDRATDVVAESLVADIGRLRSAVAARGRITETSRRLWNRQTDGYVKDHRDEAVELRDDLAAFIRQSKEADVPSLEARLFGTRRERRRLAAEVEALEEARRREELDEANTALAELTRLLAERERLPDEGTLRSVEASITEAMEASDATAHHEARLDQTRGQARRLALGTVLAALLAAGIGAWALTALGVSPLAVVAVGVFVALVAAVPAGLTLYYWRDHGAAADELATLQRRRREAVAEAKRHGFSADDLPAILEEVTRSIERHRDLDRDLTAAATTIKHKLGVDADAPAELVEPAEVEIARREAALPDEVETAYDAARLEAVEGELETVDAAIDELEEELRVHRRQVRSHLDALGDIPFGDYGVERPPTEVRSLEGLEGVVDGLEELVRAIETDAANADAALTVLEAVETAERAAVEELFFGAESAVSEYFSTITDGRYRAVSYDANDETLVVETAGGRELTPAQLSQSTFDQLYFAVRLAFAQELLEGTPGVLILDDAFLAADADRFDRQADLVAGMAADGWQLLYFTAKADARDRLTAVPGSSAHELTELDLS